MTEGLAPAGLEEGLAWLLARDPRFLGIVERAGAPRFRRRPATFGTLLHAILEQQISIDAAAAMYARLRESCAPLTPARFLALDDATLRRCGFSRQKQAYGRGLAAAIRERRFDPEKLRRMDDDAAFAALTTLKGIGRWTAEVFMLFALGRPDIWPADDLGLQLGAQEALNLPDRPRERVLREMGEAWRPWRSVAACLLWQAYLHERGRKAPLLPA